MRFTRLQNAPWSPRVAFGVGTYGETLLLCGGQFDNEYTPGGSNSALDDVYTATLETAATPTNVSVSWAKQPGRSLGGRVAPIVLMASERESVVFGGYNITYEGDHKSSVVWWTDMYRTQDAGGSWAQIQSLLDVRRDGGDYGYTWDLRPSNTLLWVYFERAPPLQHRGARKALLTDRNGAVIRHIDVKAWFPSRLMQRVAMFATTARGDALVAGGSTVFHGGGGSMLNDVWITHDGGVTWQCQTLNAPWQPRAGGRIVALPLGVGGGLFLAGGYSDPEGAYTLYDVWSSFDDGVTWTCVVVEAPWNPRALFGFAYLELKGASEEAKASGEAGRILVFGGREGVADTGTGGTAYFNDVWIARLPQHLPTPPPTASSDPAWRSPAGEAALIVGLGVAFAALILALLAAVTLVTATAVRKRRRGRRGSESRGDAMRSALLPTAGERLDGGTVVPAATAAAIAASAWAPTVAPLRAAVRAELVARWNALTQSVKQRGMEVSGAVQPFEFGGAHAAARGSRGATLARTAGRSLRIHVAAAGKLGQGRFGSVQVGWLEKGAHAGGGGAAAADADAVGEFVAVKTTLTKLSCEAPPMGNPLGTSLGSGELRSDGVLSSSSGVVGFTSLSLNSNAAAEWDHGPFVGVGDGDGDGDGGSSGSAFVVISTTRTTGTPTTPLTSWQGSAGSSAAASSGPSEGRTLAAVQGHPNVIGLRGAIAGGFVKQHLVMELCACSLSHSAMRTTLPTLCALLRLDPDAQTHVALGLLHGIAHLHACGMCHRDLKPSNVLVSFRDDGPHDGGDSRFGFVVKISDFGLAKQLQLQRENRSGNGGVGGGDDAERMLEDTMLFTVKQGTVGWRAPELHSADQLYIGIDSMAGLQAADAFTLGLLLAYVFSGCVKHFPWSAADAVALFNGTADKTHRLKLGALVATMVAAGDGVDVEETAPRWQRVTPQRVALRVAAVAGLMSRQPAARMRAQSAALLLAQRVGALQAASGDAQAHALLVHAGASGAALATAYISAGGYAPGQCRILRVGTQSGAALVAKLGVLRRRLRGLKAVHLYVEDSDAACGAELLRAVGLTWSRDSGVAVVAMGGAFPAATVRALASATRPALGWAGRSRSSDAASDSNDDAHGTFAVELHAGLGEGSSSGGGRWASLRAAYDAASVGMSSVGEWRGVCSDALKIFEPKYALLSADDLSVVDAATGRVTVAVGLHSVGAIAVGEPFWEGGR